MEAVMDPTAPANTIPTLPLVVLGVGFVAAVTLGSIAWFNSKRPPGWETAERPDYVPKVSEDAPDAVKPDTSSDSQP